MSQRLRSAAMPGEPSSRLGFWLGLTLFLGSLLLFWPAAGFEYSTFDDGPYVADNPSVLGGLTAEGFRQAVRTQHNYWLPTLWVSYMVDAQVFGRSPVGFHITNILLHSLNTLLFFALLRRMTGRTLAAAVAAGLWAVHPLRVETVAWITERKGLLSTFLALLALWAWLGYLEHRRGRWLAGSLVLFALGLAAKPMLVTFPVLLLVLDLWPLRRWQDGGQSHALRLIWEKAPFFLLAAASAAFTLYTQSSSFYPRDEAFRAATLANASSSYFFYLRDLAWPVGLGPRFISPIAERLTPTLALSLVALLLSLVAAWAARRRHPALSAGWLWYAACLFPVSGVVPVGLQWTGDRFTYLPHLLLFAGIVFTALDALRPEWARRSAFLGVVLLAAAWSTVSHFQLRHWKDPVAFSDRAVAIAPEDFNALLARAKAVGFRNLDFVGGTDALERLVELFPDSKEAHYYLGIILSWQGRSEEAVPHLFWTTQLDPHATTAILKLADVLYDLGRMEEAAVQYRRYVETRPGEAKRPYALHRLGTLLFSAGYHQDAANYLSRAAALLPSSALFRYDLAVVLAAAGRTGEAATHYRTAIRLNPSDFQARLNLGELLIGQGDYSGAAAVLEETAEKWPDSAEGWYASGRLAEMAGDTRMARRAYRRAIEKSPSASLLRESLERTLRDLP